jgi:nicotinamide phosphoribosyltransferase
MDRNIKTKGALVMFDISILDNMLLNSDSYKYSHWNLYPNNATHASSYIEARGPIGEETVFFGPQMFIKRYLLRRITHDDVDVAKSIIVPHGLPFNEDGFRRIVVGHDGRWPVKIKAVKEGTRVKTGNVLSTVESTDPRLLWVESFLETAYVRAVWYPTTVASNSYACKKILRKYLEETSDLTGDDFAMKLSFMLHDFGARGVSSKESAEIGGLAHLINFRGTDTIGALLAGRVFYNEPMAGHSVSANEHSTVTSWGKDRELDFYRHQLATIGKPGAIFSSVIDSYDAGNAIGNLWYSLKDDLIASGAKLVFRPDSGEPTETLPRLLNIAGAKYGFTVNSKGYKVLPAYIGFLQGDGISRKTLAGICAAIMAAGWSLENLVFGMGGGLLQHCNRDDYRFAMKMSAMFMSQPGWHDMVAEEGSWIDVYKDPIDDPGKRSKRGRLGLYYDAEGNDVTGPAGQAGDRLETIYDGDLTRDQSFSEVRELAARE